VPISAATSSSRWRSIASRGASGSASPLRASCAKLARTATNDSKLPTSPGCADPRWAANVGDSNLPGLKTARVQEDQEHYLADDGPPWLLAIRAVLALIAYGALWLSVALGANG
jgi:hypothetical protein